jgi:hypothetical protein
LLDAALDPLLVLVAPDVEALDVEALEAEAAAGAEVEPPEPPSEPVEADVAALSAAVTAGAGSLVLELPLSPPPLLRKSVTYQPEPLS